jgi:hypothetical protein
MAHGVATRPQGPVDFSGTWESTSVEVRHTGVRNTHYWEVRGPAPVATASCPTFLHTARLPDPPPHALGAFQNLDAFLEARGVPYLKRLIAGALGHPRV